MNNGLRKLRRRVQQDHSTNDDPSEVYGILFDILEIGNTETNVSNLLSFIMLKSTRLLLPTFSSSSSPHLEEHRPS